ncbi:EIF-2B GDP-GTP exchange factor subunit alpha [Aphelenchoides bicaudatus]|nr:EIF-2B GDP-GTP exchange factor subunit alpha [Aphelenchoides bicaudatus]
MAKNSISNAKAYFEKLIDDDPHKSTGLAAIETLMEKLANTQATNVQTLTTELQKTVDELISTDKSTASIKSAAELFLRFISLVKTEQLDGENFDKLMATYKHRGSQFIRRISQSKALISKFATPFVQHNAKLLTHSYSKIVLSALLEAKNRGHVFQVFVTESAPDFSGRKMHAALTEHGIDSTLVLDGAVGYLMERVDSVLLGAEAILENGGIINKVSLYWLFITIDLFRLARLVCASWPKNFNKNIYVFAESIKFTKEFPINQRDIHESFKYRTSTLKNTDSLKYEHPLIDYTPPAYITLIISDLGILPPAKICDELLNLYS